MRAMANAPAFPALTPRRDDTALFQDGRSFFSHLLPGRPVLGFVTGRPDEPPADAVVHLQDAPITLRYRLEAPAFAAPTAAELARLTAERYAAWRASGPVPVDFANPSWNRAWSVEGAAVASYDVGGNAHEELFVLVKNGMVLVVTWTYPKGFAEDPAYASFASVAEATMIWDAARWEQNGRVWPDSPFLETGLNARPRPKHYEAAKRLRFAPLGPDERRHLLAILAGVSGSAGAPWVVLAPQVKDGHKRALLGAARDASVKEFIETAFADVRTAHDLRGLAILMGRAIDGSLATTSSPPPLLGPPPTPIPAPPRLPT